MSPEGYVISGLVGIITAYLAYLGVRDQNRTAKQGSDAAVQSTEQREVLEAWKDMAQTMVEPLTFQLEKANGKIEDLQTAHGEHEQRLAALTNELHRWQSVAKTLARWGITMRDQLRGLGHEVPAEPDELVALRIVSDVNDQNTL
jgi:chromosome segregation ATPase